MYSYLAVLEKEDISKNVLIEYFAGQGIIIEKFYSSIGVIKLTSKNKLIASKLKYISSLELDRKGFNL